MTDRRLTLVAPPDKDATEIGQLYRKAHGSLIDSVNYAMQCGQRLAAKKKEVGHGNWLSWLAANADALGFHSQSI
jgi:hypothetical protein